MRLWLGNNLLDDASGVLYVDGKELLSVGLTPSGATLPNALIYSETGELVARLRHGAWVHKDQAHVVDTSPDHLLLSKKGGGAVLRLERHPDGDEVDAVLITHLDMWSRAGFHYTIEDRGPLVIWDRNGNKLATFEACRFRKGFRGFQATSEEDGAFVLAADVLQISRAARDLTVERSEFIPPGAED